MHNDKSPDLVAYARCSHLYLSGVPRNRKGRNRTSDVLDRMPETDSIFLRTLDAHILGEVSPNFKQCPQKSLTMYGDGHWEYTYESRMHINKNGSLQ